MQNAIFTVFLPTFIVVSITPGMCMTLALSLGMSIGLRQSLWMMLGELTGVGLVALMAMIGVSGLVLSYPKAFTLFTWLGGGYLVYLGIALWRARGRLAMDLNTAQGVNAQPWSLISQGFITAIANPKGWAFFMVLLPPFIDTRQALWPQIALILPIILIVEWASLMIYASGGQSLAALLSKPENVRWLNRIAGVLMMAVGLWLALGSHPSSYASS